MVGPAQSEPPEAMPRFRCETCCCGPAIVLHPPRGATPICSSCGAALTRQPLVRPVAFLVLIAVGSVLVLGSFPLLMEPRPERETHSETTA